MPIHQTSVSTDLSESSIMPDPLRDWVSDAIRRGLNPAAVRTSLTRYGWPEVVVAEAVREVERNGTHPRGVATPPPPPDRVHEHALAYSVLFVAIGLAVLALGSTLHLLLENAQATRSGSWAIANWLTLFICASPFAVAAHRAVARIEASDPLARFSQVRDTLSLVLLWSAGVVGVARLLVFVHQLISSLVVDRDPDSLGRDLVHVTVVVFLAGSVFAWTWLFRHPERRSSTER